MTIISRKKKNIQLDLLYLSVSTHAVMDQFRHQGPVVWKPVELILDKLNLNCQWIIIYHSKRTFGKILALGYKLDSFFHLPVALNVCEIDLDGENWNLRFLVNPRLTFVAFWATGPTISPLYGLLNSEAILNRELKKLWWWQQWQNCDYNFFCTSFSQSFMFFSTMWNDLFCNYVDLSTWWPTLNFLF